MSIIQRGFRTMVLFAPAAVAPLLPVGTVLGQDALSDELQEITVTATRQVDTVNRVPISVTAETQQTLDQQGLKSLADLAGEVAPVNRTR